jgi:hypothetical protein
MLLRCAITCCAVSFGAVTGSFGDIACGGELDHLSIKNLKPGDQLEVVTSDAVYRAQLLDPSTGETRMVVSTDGLEFSEPQTVYLLGATQGPYAEAGGLMLVKMNEVKKGMRLELGVGSLGKSDRRITQPVQLIRKD